MRLLIIGTLDGQVGAASQIALKRGAKVSHVDTIEQGLDFLRSGRGADLVLADVKEDLATLISSLKSERIAVPVVATTLRPPYAPSRPGQKNTSHYRPTLS